MSFPRSTRFPKEKDVVPAPGHYDVKHEPLKANAPSFEGTSRFTTKGEDNTDKIFAVPQTPLPSSSSKKKLNFDQPKKTTPSASPVHINKEKQKYETEIRRLVHQLNELEIARKSQQNEMTKLESRIGHLSKENSSLSAAVATLEKKRSQLEKKNAALGHEKSLDAEKKLKRSNSEIELQKIKGQFKKSQQESSKLQSQIQDVLLDLKQTKMSLKALEDANAGIKTMNSEIQLHSEEVEEQITQMQKITDGLRSEKQDLISKLQSAATTISQLEHKHATNVKTLSQQICREFKGKNEELVEKLHTLLNRIEDSDLKVKKTIEICSKVTNERDLLKQQGIEKSNQISSLQTKLQEFAETVRSTESKLETAELNFAISNQEITSLRCDNEKLHNDVNSSCKANAATLAALQIKCEQYEEQMAALECHQADRINTIKSLQDEKVEQDIAIARLEEENQQYKEDVHNMQKKWNKYEQDISKITILSEKKISDLENAKSDLESQVVVWEQWEKKLLENQQLLNEKISENDRLQSDVETVNKNLERSSSQVSELMQRLHHVSNKENRLQERVSDLEQTLEQKDEEGGKKLKEFTRRLLETQKKLNTKESELKKIYENSKITERKIAEMTEDKQRFELEKKHLVHEIDEKNSHIEKFQNVMKEGGQDDSEKLLTEIEKWKDLYEDLQEKVAPFREQLDMYAVERSSWLNETSAAQQEVSKLGKRYAELLGHHNHKQKIKHIVKLKEDNLHLKQDNAKLQLQVSKLQKQVVANRKPNFDPKKAFQSSKENNQLASNQ